MLEIPVIVLVLQIGFNAALNYRGHNQSPLNPAPRLLSYGQSRRLLSPNRYLPLPTRRIPETDSSQSDSEDLSLEESINRHQHLLQNHPYQGQDSLRYNTRTENDVSLEMAPIGRMSLDNYANGHMSPLSAVNWADANFRRPYLRNKPLNRRTAQTHKYNIKGDDDLTLEELDKQNPFDSTSNNLAATQTGADASYLRSLLGLMELPNLRRNQNLKYHRKGDNDLSLEVSPVNKLNHDQDSLNDLPPLRSNLNDARFLQSLMSGLEYSRRANLGLENLRFNRLRLNEDDANSNTLRSLQSNSRFSYNRRNDHNDNKKAVNNLLLDMLSPDTDTPDAYLDTVFLVSGEGKPDDIAVARPQLRNTDQAYVRNNEYNNRRNYDRLSFDVSSNGRLRDDESSSNLSAFRGLKKSLRNRNPSNDSPNGNRQSNRRSNDDVDLESMSNDRLSPDDDDLNTMPFLSLINHDDSNLETPQLRSRDQNLKNNRRDHNNDLNLARSSNDRVDIDMDAANLANLRSDNLDEMNFVPPSLRNNELSNEKNSRRENDNIRRELLNDRLSAEDDTLSDLSILRLGSLDNLSIETPILRNRDSSSSSQNKNLRTSEGDNYVEDLELLFNDRLSLEDNIPDSLPYDDLTLRRREPTKNSQNDKMNYNKQDDEDDEVSLELLSNDRLDLDENAASDLSVLSLEESRLRSSAQSNKGGKTKNNRRDDDGMDLEFLMVNGLNSDNSAVSLSKSNARLRSGDEKPTSKQDTDELHLEFPWNDQLSPDDKDTSSSSSSHGISPQLRSEKKPKKQVEDPKDYDLYLEFPWTDKTVPDEVTKAPKLRSSRTENEQSFLRNRNKQRNNKRRSYDDLSVLPLPLQDNEDSLIESLENSQSDVNSFLRQSIGSINENHDLEFVPYVRSLENNSNLYINSEEEDPGSFISFPLDRRPNTRHRNREEDTPLNAKRRNLHLSRSNPKTSGHLRTTEEGNDSGTYNDTIIFPAH